MINRNEFSKSDYVIVNLSFGLVFTLAYIKWMFLPVPGFSNYDSKLMLCIAESAFAVAGVVFTFKRRRSMTSLLANTLFALDLYALITYYRFFPTAVICLSAIVLISSAVYFCAVLMHRQSISTGNTLSLFKRIWHGLLGSRAIITAVISYFLLIMTILSISGTRLYAPDIEPVSTPTVDSEWSVTNKYDTVKLLNENSWDTLDAKERLDVLQTVVNIEVRYLGIGHPISLKATVLEDDSNILCKYDDHRIIIDLAFLTDNEAHKVLNSICRECYIAYMRRQVEVYTLIPEEYRNMRMFGNAKLWEGLFIEYDSGDYNYADYIFAYNNHADQYAASAVEEYYSLIERDGKA